MGNKDQEAPTAHLGWKLRNSRQRMQGTSPPPLAEGGGLRAELPGRLGWPTGHERRTKGCAVKGRREPAEDPPHTTLAPTHQGSQGLQPQPGGAVLCAGCKGWGLVYAPPRLSVYVCERVWRGQRRTQCSERGQRPGAKLRTVSSCLRQMLPRRGILTPLLDFLRTGM